MKKLLKITKRTIRRTLECAELVLLYILWGGKKRTAPERLVVIQNSHLGDFVLSLPFFQRLKNECDLPLTLVSDERISELASASGVFDEFIGIDFKRASSYKHIFFRWKTLGRLRNLSAQKAVQCFGVGATNLEDCMLLAVRAVDKYVFVDSFYNVQRNGVFYDALRTKFFEHSLPYRMELSLVANENNYANFITGIDKPLSIGNLEMFEPLPEKDAILQDYCLIIPGADDPHRRWEPEKFACLARQVVETFPQLNILLNGSPAEAETVRKVYDNLPEKVQKSARIRTPHPDKLSSIKQLMSDCKHARLVVTNDTGPMHIAAKYGVRTICITGGWHWGVFVPCSEYESVKFIHQKMDCYCCGGVCEYSGTPFECLKTLAVESAGIWLYKEKPAEQFSNELC